MKYLELKLLMWEDALIITAKAFEEIKSSHKDIGDELNIVWEKQLQDKACGKCPDRNRCRKGKGYNCENCDWNVSLSGAEMDSIISQKTLNAYKRLNNLIVKYANQNKETKLLYKRNNDLWKVLLRK